MAHTIQVTKILPGTYRTQVHVGLISDGGSGELTDYVLIDPVVDLGILSTARTAIEKISYNFSGFDARIEFDTGVIEDKIIWVLPEHGNSPIDFDIWGGLKDQSGLDGTGKIQITTTGFGDVGDQGSMLFMVRND